VEMSVRAILIGEFFIRRIFTVTAVKFFTLYITCLKIVSRPILNNLSSSNLKLLDITVGLIKSHVGRKLFNGT